MDYEKKYKETLEKARQLCAYSSTKPFISDLQNLFPELAESEDERIRNEIIELVNMFDGDPNNKAEWIAWLEKQGEQKLTLPKWKYKKDNTPLLRDSLILNKYGCVAKSPSGALVSDVWVIDYDELAKLPKEEFEKPGEQKPAEFDDTNAKRMFIKALERVEEQNNKGYKLTDCDKNSWWEDFKAYTSCTIEQNPAWSEEDETNACVYYSNSKVD